MREVGCEVLRRGSPFFRRWVPSLSFCLSFFLLILPLEDRIIFEHRRLEREEEAAEAVIEDAEAKLREGLARLKRLRKQKKLVREKGVQMVERGLKDLDELEALEAAEAQATTSAAAAAIVDWPPVDLGGWNFASVEGTSGTFLEGAPGGYVGTSGPPTAG